MGKLDKELEHLVSSAKGGGFGDPDAKAEFERDIEHLKFRITRRDNFRIAVISALIGAVVGGAVTLISQALG